MSLASFAERRSAGEYTYYEAVLVARAWRLSNYRTNEIYTTESTVDNVLRAAFGAGPTWRQ